MSHAGFSLALVVNIIFDIYIYILLIRLFLQKFSARYTNPISQFVIKATEFILKPLRRLIPGYRGFDLAIVVLILILAAVQISLVMWLSYKIFPSFFGLLLIVIATLLKKTLELFFIVILIAAVLSWFPALRPNSFTEIINLLAAPLIRFTHRFIPTWKRIDFSPLILLIVLKLISIFVMTPIIHVGIRLAMR